MSGVNAPLHRAESQSRPCARSRSRLGSHVVKMRVRLGKQPASPAPKSVSVTMSEVALHVEPIAAVKNDHHRTMRISTRRGPMRSPSRPPGISNRAYANTKADSAQLICTFDRWRSRWIDGAACEMPTRSRYWMTARSMAKATVTYRARVGAGEAIGRKYCHSFPDRRSERDIG